MMDPGALDGLFMPRSLKSLHYDVSEAYQMVPSLMHAIDIFRARSSFILRKMLGSWALISVPVEAWSLVPPSFMDTQL